MNERDELIRYRISKKVDESFILDLLLLTDESTFHYVLITNLVNLVQKVRGNVVNRRSDICRNCFHIQSDLDVLVRHHELCYQHDAVRINMSTGSSINLSFRKLQAHYIAPIVLYFDIESLLLPIETVTNSPDKSSSENVRKHVPSGYCLVAIEQEIGKQLMFKLNRSEDCMIEFVRTIEVLAYDIYNKNNSFGI